MSAFDSRYIGSSQYKYVSKLLVRGKKIRWQAHVRSSKAKSFDTERQAAIHVDKELIRLGREPVNILKRKPDND